MADCRLYLISPPSIDLEKFEETLNLTLKAGDVASFQLRLKDVPDEDIIKAAKILLPVCHKYDVAFILNDDPKLALKIGADGVHLGQGDMSIKEARALIGDKMVIGATCNSSKHKAMVAGEAGADYIAFGAFFPTTTKETTEQADKSLLTWWSSLFELPCVAIGGITVKNAAEIISESADFIAVSSGVWDHPEGPEAAVKEFNRLISVN